MIGNIRAKAILNVKTVLPYLPVTFAVAAILLLLPSLIRDHIYGIGPLPALIVIGVFAVLIARGRIRRFLMLWGFVVGTLTGLFMSMDDVEHMNRFSRCDCGMNVIHLAILGVLAGGVIDFCKNPPKPETFRQFSLATLLGAVTAVAMICASIRMYMSIKPWP
jgi:hypothetical protein